MQILKIGGSVVTVKDQEFTSNNENIRRITDEIKAVWPTPLIIIHGGGSFGHPIAKQFGISEGLKSKRQIPGFAKTHAAMMKLNSIIVNIFLEKGIPSMSLSPSSFITTTNGRISKADYSIVGRLVVNGVLPVLFGDAVLDTKNGFAILSGDQLAVHLAIALGASKIIFGVDVNGIYTSNPRLSPDARLIDQLELEKINGYIKIGKSLSTDVTGGMLGKVSEAKEAVKSGVKVQIVNATKTDVILKALKDEPVTGTILKG
jgi:isopentenyl phosphate kinase